VDVSPDAVVALRS